MESIGNLSGHSQKVPINYARTDIRKYYFTNRVSAVWNRLPEEVVSAPTLSIFKDALELRSN